MQFNELNHIAGPAIVTFNSQVWHVEADISVDIVQSEWEPTTSRFGGIGPRIKSLPVAKVSFKPDGQVTTDRMTNAFPYTCADVGKSIFTAVDMPLTIQTLAGQLYTFLKAGLSGTPSLYLGADKTAFDGTLQFTCLGATDADPAAADSFLKIATSAFADASFDESTVLSPGYTAAWGEGDGLTEMETIDGFRIECPIKTTELSVNRFGVIGCYLTGIGPAACRFTPAGMTEAGWLTLVNLDGGDVSLPGAPAGGAGQDLVITGDGLVVTLPKCGAMASKLAFGTAKERLGEVTFHNRMVFTAGVPAAPLTIAVG